MDDIIGIRSKAPNFDEDCLQLHRVLAQACPTMMKYMWQSRVEIKYYSVAYFDRITAFKAPYRWISVKGGAHNYALRRLVIYSCIYEVHMSPGLNGSSVIRCFKHSDAIEIHDRIIFNFYTGLSHIAEHNHVVNLSHCTLLVAVC